MLNTFLINLESMKLLRRWERQHVEHPRRNFWLIFAHGMNFYLALREDQSLKCCVGRDLLSWNRRYFTELYSAAADSIRSTIPKEMRIQAIKVLWF